MSEQWRRSARELRERGYQAYGHQAHELFTSFGFQPANPNACGPCYPLFAYITEALPEIFSDPTSDQD